MHAIKSRLLAIDLPKKEPNSNALLIFKEAILLWNYRDFICLILSQTLFTNGIVAADQLSTYRKCNE